MVNQGVQVQVPFTSEMMWVDETKVKPPKLRFKPGMLFIYEGEIIVIDAAFRLRDNDREWMFHCSVLSRVVDTVAKQNALATVETSHKDGTPKRVVYWLFRSSLDAWHYFGFAHQGGCDGRTIGNKNLIQKGERLIAVPMPI